MLLTKLATTILHCIHSLILSSFKHLLQRFTKIWVTKIITLCYLCPDGYPLVLEVKYYTTGSQLFFFSLYLLSKIRFIPYYCW